LAASASRRAALQKYPRSRSYTSKTRNQSGTRARVERKMIARVYGFGNRISNLELRAQRPLDRELDGPRDVVSVRRVVVGTDIDQRPTVPELKRALAIRRLGSLLQQ
jgi:hypothetical protein